MDTEGNIFTSSSISSSAAKLVLLNIIMVSDCIINYFLSVEILAWTTPV